MITPTLTLMPSELTPFSSDWPPTRGSAAQRLTLPNSVASADLRPAIAKCSEILRILSFLVIATTSTTYTTTTMPNTIASYLSSVPLTSELYAPSQVQIPSDFPSTATSKSTDSTFPSSGYEGVDWDRLLGYQPPNGALKRGRSSWIYSWGWRIIKRNNNEAYWLYRLCYHGRGAPRPTSHIYKANATNRAMYHLKAVHRVSEDSQLPVDDSTQSTLETFANPRPRDFNSFVFRSMILRLFTTRQLPLSLIEDEAFRALLIYLEPYLEKSIPSRRSLGRYITKAYDTSQSKVEQSLLGAITKINVAFDIWTSPGRQFSLLSVVGHYLDH
jgi:hypothetical protein